MITFKKKSVINTVYISISEIKLKTCCVFGGGQFHYYSILIAVLAVVYDRTG